MSAATPGDHAAACGRHVICGASKTVPVVTLAVNSAAPASIMRAELSEGRNLVMSSSSAPGGEMGEHDSAS